MIPMSSPDITGTERAAVLRVLESTYLSNGPRLAAFEQAIAGYTGTDHAVGVNSGTAGLHLAMIAAGVGPGDTVVTSPFSFVASANVALYQGAEPVFVDVDRYGNLHPGLLAETVHALAQEGKKPKAIIPVHICGQPADMDPILEVGREWGIPVIEDACEALGSEYKGRPAGSMGDAAVFAFYPNKQVTCGEGGMIVTNNAEWDRLFRSLRNQGRDDPSAWLEHARLGYNYRLPELSAALGLAQFGRITELIAKRAQVARWYHERLRDLDEDIQRPRVAHTTTRMSWFIYLIRILGPAKRDTVMRVLAEDGIPTRTYFAPIHLQPFYQERFGYKRSAFPVAEFLGDRSLALPFSSAMTEREVEAVCRSLRKALTSPTG